MQIRKIIITGPTGGVGRGIIDALHAQNIHVTAIVRPNSQRAEALKEGPLLTKIACDLTDLNKLTEKLTDKYDAFFHLGWTGTYGEARNDREMQEKNIEITCNAVRLAAHCGCQVFVYAGSQGEYGKTEEVMRPDLPCHPETEYGKAKLAAGEASRKLAAALGIRHVHCRILSAYGPGDAPYTMVCGTLLAFLKNEERKFTKGEQIWDYMYTKDLGRAFLAAARKGKDGAIYVLGSGKGAPLREYIEIMRDVAAPSRELIFGEIPYYPNQVMHMLADISTLTEDTGFVPAYSFEEGIRETVAYLAEKEGITWKK